MVEMPFLSQPKNPGQMLPRVFWLHGRILGLEGKLQHKQHLLTFFIHDFICLHDL